MAKWARSWSIVRICGMRVNGVYALTSKGSVPMKARWLALSAGVASAAMLGYGEACRAAPDFDLQRQCLDGGLPYPVGAHLCTSQGIVEICLRPDQTYGVKGIYTYNRNDKTVLHFDKAHWVSTTSSHCGPNDIGKVYRSSNPRL
jgi:hypothetical protein